MRTPPLYLLQLAIFVFACQSNSIVIFGYVLAETGIFNYQLKNHIFKVCMMCLQMQDERSVLLLLADCFEKNTED